VNIDYHVEVERHYYSVPYTLARQAVEVRCRRDLSLRPPGRCPFRRVGGYGTVPGYRPKGHQKHLEWSPSRLTRWGEGMGVSTGALVQKILDSRQVELSLPADHENVRGAAYFNS
jgi:hypothetical protein